MGYMETILGEFKLDENQRILINLEGGDAMGGNRSIVIPGNMLELLQGHNNLNYLYFDCCY